MTSDHYVWNVGTFRWIGLHKTNSVGTSDVMTLWSYDQGGLNDKETEMNLRSTFSISISNEFYLFA